MNGDAVIDVHGLTKRFDGKTVVDHVDLSVKRGEIVGFLGPNGSGKTTTIRMICGLLTPDAGAGEVLGYDILTRGRPDQARGRLHDAALLVLRGPDDRRESRLRRAALRPASRARDYVDRHARPPRPRPTGSDQLAGTLSGGWKQRLALAACIMHQPQLLLLDEPTAGVDPKARREFWDEIHGLAAEGLTVLVSTHYMDEAERCHRIVYIAYGRLIAPRHRRRGDRRLRPPHLRRPRRRRRGDRAPRSGAATASTRSRRSATTCTSSAPIPAGSARASATAIAGTSAVAEPDATSLEDVFIHFMGAESAGTDMSARPRAPRRLLARPRRRGAGEGVHPDAARPADLRHDARRAGHPARAVRLRHQHRPEAAADAR